MTTYDKEQLLLAKTFSDTTEVTPENIEFLRGIIVNNFYIRHPESRRQVLRVERIFMSYANDEKFPAGQNPFREVNLFGYVTVLKTKKFKR